MTRPELNRVARRSLNFCANFIVDSYRVGFVWSLTELDFRVDTNQLLLVTGRRSLNRSHHSESGIRVIDRAEI